VTSLSKIWHYLEKVIGWLGLSGWAFGVIAEARGWDKALVQAGNNFAPVAVEIFGWMFNGYTAAVALAFIAWRHGYMKGRKAEAGSPEAEAKRKREAGEQSHAEYTLGSNMTDMGDRLHRMVEMGRRPTRHDHADLIEIEASMRRLGLPTPGMPILTEPGSRLLVSEFMTVVGRLLENHHLDEARRQAADLIPRLSPPANANG
jgi:hypothetical protein